MRPVRDKLHTHAHTALFGLVFVATLTVCVCSGHNAERRLAELETLCKQKEEERVELELRLTEVKENLKKSLARGALGPPTDTKISVKVGCCQTQRRDEITIILCCWSDCRLLLFPSHHIGAFQLDS